MSCCHHYDFFDGHEHVFAVDPSAIRFGQGALAEIGHDARELGLARVALSPTAESPDWRPSRRCHRRYARSMST